MIALLLLQAAAVAAPAPAPVWKVADRTNAAGIRSVSAAVTGQDGVSRFVVKCDVAKEPILSVQFIQPSPLGGGADKPVAVRFDGGPAFVYNWQFPGGGTYITDPEAVTKLTSFLVRSKTVRVETTNAGNFAIVADFAGPGGEAVVRQVLDVCHFALGVGPIVAAAAPATPPAPVKPAPVAARRKARK